ncbi:MAG: SurA N-terminal domain-containing protein, partial [bacterium]
MPWALVLVLPACNSTLYFKNPPIPPDKTAVLLNGKPISLAEFDTEFRLMAIHYSAVSETQMRVIKRRLFDQVVDRELILQEARKEGVGLTREEWNRDVKNAFARMPDDFLEILKVQGVSEGTWKRKLMEECLAAKLVERDVNSKVNITPREVEDYYWSHLSDYWKPESVRLQHLVVRKHGDLKKALKRLKSGENFTQVAGDLSLADDKVQGGDWGWVSV